MEDGDKVMPAVSGRVGLALGGGAARGGAHIGVIQALEELEIPIDAIVGTSAGSIVGALYAYGIEVVELQTAARQASWRTLVDFVFPRRGLVKAEGLEEFLRKMLNKAHFSDLQIPFAAVACDLLTGKEVVFSAGPVARAVTASCAVPGVFVPVEVDGMVVVDGGLVNNVPVSVIPEIASVDTIIAVDLGSSSLVSVSQRPENILDILMRSLDIVQGRAARMETKDADIVIQPQLGSYSLTDLRRADDLFAEGYRAASEALRHA